MLKDGSKLWYLAKINLFKELSEETLREIAESSRMRDYERNIYISTPHDEKSELIYFLKKGEVEIYESAEGGKKMIVDILTPGDVFGYTNISNGDTAGSRRFIKATAPVTLCIMPHRDFLALLEDHPHIALEIIKNLSMQLAATESRLRDAAFSNVETRVFQELERLWKRHGIEENGVRKIMRRFTHEEFAQLVGTARETITRALSRLAKKKKIAIDRDGNIVIK